MISMRDTTLADMAAAHRLLRDAGATGRDIHRQAVRVAVSLTARAEAAEAAERARREEQFWRDHQHNAAFLQRTRDRKL